ncbi:hypothetical protein Gorai_008313 [Gossypium raimondii]|uniref:Uncharacterized protein n=1 Tax=Gossypium raimondii TaxID=29730 RepID=A0A7J8QBB2_GOSRA|nr:hypothetical protein [Gossypium raimondii]
MGVSIRPEAMAWLWICLSWSMDLLNSIRENVSKKIEKLRSAVTVV